MHLKPLSRKGYYFIFDAFLAIFLIIVAFTIFFSKPVTVPTKSRAISTANDIISYLSTIRIEDVNDPFIGVGGVLWNSSDITNPKNTLLQQIGEFYRLDKNELAGIFIEKSLINVPKQFNIKISISGVPLYPDEDKYSDERSEILVKSRAVVFGEYMPTKEMWGPYSFEVGVWE